MMKSSSKKYVTSLCVFWCIAFVVFGAAYLLLVRPQSQDVEKIKKQLTQSENDYKTAQEARSKESRIKLQDKLHEAQNMMNSFSVNSENVATLIFEISQIAQKLGLEDFASKHDDSISCDLIAGCKNLGRVGVNITFSADFPQFAKFVNELERHKPFVFVETFNIDRGTKSDSKPKVKIQLVFLVEHNYAQKKV